MRTNAIFTPDKDKKIARIFQAKNFEFLSSSDEFRNVLISIPDQWHFLLKFLIIWPNHKIIHLVKLVLISLLIYNKLIKIGKFVKKWLPLVNTVPNWGILSTLANMFSNLGIPFPRVYIKSIIPGKRIVHQMLMVSPWQTRRLGIYKYCRERAKQHKQQLSCTMIGPNPNGNCNVLTKTEISNQFS